MSINETLPVTTSPHVDGFDAPDEGGGAGIIKGAKLKFNNTQWTDDNDEVIAKERQFIAVKISKVVQKWIDQKPVETRILGPEQYFPDVERMNAEAPPAEWRDHYGVKKGPWEKSYVVYLLCPESMQGYTYPTSTVGGMRAVSDLKDNVKRARLLRGENVYPLVTLGDAHMPSAYGGRQRPSFKIVKFVPIGAAPAQSPQQLAKPANDMSDAIPF
jgi:hypothetical protein